MRATAAVCVIIVSLFCQALSVILGHAGPGVFNVSTRSNEITPSHTRCLNNLGVPVRTEPQIRRDHA
jgi:hypothetical protein